MDYQQLSLLKVFSLHNINFVPGKGNTLYNLALVLQQELVELSFGLGFFVYFNVISTFVG